MLGMPKVIPDASKVHESEKRVADGIIKSGMLTSFQRESMDGIVKSSLPERAHVPQLQKVTPPATHQRIGVVHYPGSRYRR